MSTLANLDKTLAGQLKNPVVSTIVRVVLVAYILLLSSVDHKILSLFENIYFQIFYFAALAYVAMVDPTTSVMMAAAYLFSVQQLNRAPSFKQVKLPSNTPVVSEVRLNNSGYGAMAVQNPAEGFETDGGQLVGEGSNPADRTLTENLAFTSDLQFQDAQTNALPGVSQYTGIQSQNNQLGVQGLNLPNAYDPDDNLSKF
uniref:Uncharacterized protein n=1 Tax=viral metagenome TaxID=1070528 RepID=A0A6C0E731_9ZZZZ